jgi:hypothetical protein
MSKYRVLEPVTYLQGNKVIIHTTPAETVKLDDATAAELGDAVQKHGGQDEAPAPTPDKGASQKAAPTPPKA